MVPGESQFLLMLALALKLPAFANVNDLGWVNRVIVELHFDDLAFLIDEEIDAAADLAFIVVEAVLAGHVATPVAQQRESYFNLLCPRLVAERAVHTYTQYLGICSFQFLQVLLEVLHLQRSTTGEGKNIKGKRNILLAAKIVE